MAYSAIGKMRKKNEQIYARYLYDEKEQDKIDKYLWAYVTWKQNGKRGMRPKLKAYSEMANEEVSFTFMILRSP